MFHKYEHKYKHYYTEKRETATVIITQNIGTQIKVRELRGGNVVITDQHDLSEMHVNQVHE